MNWLYYLAEANLYLGVFYLAYCLFLNKETYYLLNRAYLLFSCGVSFILPVLQIGALKPVENMANNAVAYTIPVQITQVAPTVATPVIVGHHFTLQDGLWYAYLAGVVILLLVLIVKLYHLFKLMRNSHIEQGEYKLIYLDGSDTAFSFFNYLFIGANAPGANTITRHELVHIRQKHSADILFLELLKIINWFNPFIYLLQNSLKTVHEYIADEQTIAGDTDAHAYSSFLVDNAYGAGGISITNSFFNYNLLKRRIMMLHQQRSGNWARLKYLVIIPLCAGLLCASTLAFSKTYAWVDLMPVKTVPVKTAINTKEEKTKNSTFEISGNNKINDARVPAANANLSNNSVTTDPNDVVTPSGFKKGYEKLALHFMEKSSLDLNYYTMKDFNQNNENTTVKGGIVVVGFMINKEHKLSDVRVIKSTNDGLNSVVTNSIGSFNGYVLDKPGMHTFLFNFSTHGHTEAEDEVMCRENGYDNHLTIGIAPKITVIKNNTNDKLTNKGYKYKEAGYLVKGKTDFRVIITERNGEQKEFYRNSATPDDIKLLKDKYGYVFPSIPIYSMLPPPPPIPPVGASDKKVNRHPTVADSLNEFYGYLLNHIHYPNEDKQNNYGGKVFVTFTVNTNHTLDDVEVLKSSKNSLSDEVIRVLKTCTFPQAMEPGKLYTVPVYFALQGTDNKNIDVKQSVFIDNHQRIKNPSNEYPIALNEVVVIGIK